MLGVFILWLITRGQDIEQILKELRQANYYWIMLAMGCAVMSHFLRAVRWNMLIATMGYKTSPFQTFYAVMTGYLANLAVTRMGEITRCVKLSKASKTPFNVLAGTVAAERVFDVITMFAILLVTLVTQFHFLKSFLNNLFLSPVVQQGTDNWVSLSLLLVALLSSATLFFFFLRQKIRNSAEGSFFNRLKRQLGGFVLGFKTIMTMRGKAWFLLHTFLIWGMYYMTVVLCFYALNATSHLTPVAGLTLLAVGSLGLLAPVPAGIGTYHFLTIITLTELFGIRTEAATSYAYITHATQVIVNIAGGTISWVILSLQDTRAKRNKAAP